MKLCSICLYSSIESPKIAEAVSKYADGSSKGQMDTYCKDIYKTIVQNKRKHPPVYVLDIATWKFDRINIGAKSSPPVEDLSYPLLLSALSRDPELSIDFYLADKSLEKDPGAYTLTSAGFTTQFAFSVSNVHGMHLELKKRTADIKKELDRIDEKLVTSIESHCDQLNRYVEARAYTHMTLAQTHREIMAFTLGLKAKLYAQAR